MSVYKIMNMLHLLSRRVGALRFSIIIIIKTIVAKCFHGKNVFHAKATVMGVVGLAKV